MSVSGLRIFNIEDPCQPVEVGYFTAPFKPRVFPEGSNWAYSMPTFAPERQEVWYSESYTGFYAVRLTNGIWPDDIGQPSAQPHVPCNLRAPEVAVPVPTPDPAPADGDRPALPATGGGRALLSLLTLGLGSALVRRRAVPADHWRAGRETPPERKREPAPERGPVA